jgi:hypothetical protein
MPIVIFGEMRYSIGFDPEVPLTPQFEQNKAG